MYEFMKNYNVKRLDDGIKAVLDGYVILHITKHNFFAEIRMSWVETNRKIN